MTTKAEIKQQIIKNADLLADYLYKGDTLRAYASKKVGLVVKVKNEKQVKLK